MSIAPHAGDGGIFKARTNKWFAFLCWFIAALGLGVTVITAGFPALAGGSPLLLVAFLGWLLFWRPAVVINDKGVTLENPFRTIMVPWTELVTVDTRYALTLVTPGKSYASWAAPAPGIWGGRNARPEDLRGLPGSTYGPGQSVRPGDLKSTDSGQAARQVRLRWQELIEAGGLEAGADGAGVTVKFRWPEIAATVLLLAACYVTVAL
jgi:hypothetical protein